MRHPDADPPGLDVSEHAHDALSKAVAELLVGFAPQALGIDAPRITAIVATELPEVSVHTRALDFVFQTEDGAYLHVEFQRTPADLERFLVYDAGLYRRDRRRIRTAVVYTGRATRARDRLDIGSALYHVENVFVRNLDGDRVYEQLRRKAQSGTVLDRSDAARLALLILMRHEGRALYDVAVGAARMARYIPDAEARERALAAIAVFGDEVFERPQLQRLLQEEVFRMTEAARIFIEQGEAKGRAEGEAKGRAEGEAKGRTEGEAKGRTEGEAKGRTEGILLLLRRRHGEVSAALAERIRTQSDLPTLDRWLLLATDAPSLAEFEAGMSG